MAYPRVLDISYCQAVGNVKWGTLRENRVHVIIRAGQANFEDALFQQHYDNGLATDRPGITLRLRRRRDYGATEQRIPGPDDGATGGCDPHAESEENESTGVPINERTGDKQWT